MAEIEHPTLWAYFEDGRFVHADTGITELCCQPAEAVHYEAVSLEHDNIVRLVLLNEITDDAYRRDERNSQRSENVADAFDAACAKYAQPSEKGGGDGKT